MGLHRILHAPPSPPAPPFSIPHRHSGKEEANAKKSVSRCVKKADAKMKVIVNTRFVVEIHSRCWCLWRQSPSNNSNLSPRWPGQWLFCRGCRPKRGKWEKDNERGERGRDDNWRLMTLKRSHMLETTPGLSLSQKKKKKGKKPQTRRHLSAPWWDRVPANQGQRGQTKNEGMWDMWIWMERIRAALRGIFRSEQKNTSSEGDKLHKHSSLDRRGLSRLERYNQRRRRSYIERPLGGSVAGGRAQSCLPVKLLWNFRYSSKTKWGLCITAAGPANWSCQCDTVTQINWKKPTTRD